MVLQILRALCFAPGGSRSISKCLEELVRSPGVSGRIACCFWTYLHFADVGTPLNGEYPLCITFESVAACTQSVIYQTLNIEVQVQLILLDPRLISESMLDTYVKAAA